MAKRIWPELFILLLSVILCAPSYATFFIFGAHSRLVRIGTTKTIVNNATSQVILVRIVSADDDAWICLKPRVSASAFDIDCSYSSCALEYFSLQNGAQIARENLFSYAQTFGPLYVFHHAASTSMTFDELTHQYNDDKVFLNCLRPKVTRPFLQENRQFWEDNY